MQILPPGPIDPEVRFDNHQFYKRSRAISAQTGISFNDFGTMHITGLASRRWMRFVPTFAKNSSQLKRVLAIALWQRAYGGKYKCPDGFENDLAALRKLANKHHHGNSPSTNFDLHDKVVAKAGGYLQMISTIAYLTWLCGYDSPTVAEKLDTTGTHIRIVRYRLCEIARKLGYETFQRSKVYVGGRKICISKGGSTPPLTTDQLLDCERMRNRGISWKSIAWKYGRRRKYSAGVVRDAVRKFQKRRHISKAA